MKIPIYLTIHIELNFHLLIKKLNLIFLIRILIHNELPSKRKQSGLVNSQNENTQQEIQGRQNVQLPNNNLKKKLTDQKGLAFGRKVQCIPSCSSTGSRLEKGSSELDQDWFRRYFEGRWV